MSQASETKGKAGEAADPDGSPSGSKTPTPSQQNTTYATYPCPLWGKRFDDSVETRLDPATRTTYRHISRSSLQNSKIHMRVTALLIRDEYEKLYKLISEEAPPIKVGDEYSGVAVIGQPGIGQLQFHCVSSEDCLTVMFRQVAVSELCTPSPPEPKKTHCVSNSCGRHLDFQ